MPDVILNLFIALTTAILLVRIRSEIHSGSLPNNINDTEYRSGGSTCHVRSGTKCSGCPEAQSG